MVPIKVNHIITHGWTSKSRDSAQQGRLIDWYINHSQIFDAIFAFYITFPEVFQVKKRGHKGLHVI